MHVNISKKDVAFSAVERGVLLSGVLHSFMPRVVPPRTVRKLFDEVSACNVLGLSLYLVNHALYRELSHYHGLEILSELLITRRGAFVGTTNFRIRLYSHYLHSFNSSKKVSAAFSAIATAVVMVFAATFRGGMLKSTTLSPFTPYTLR